MLDEYGIKHTNKKPKTPRPNENICSICGDEMIDDGKGYFCDRDHSSICFGCKKEMTEAADSYVCETKECGVSIKEEQNFTHDKVEITVIFQVKFNVERNHKHDLNQSFMLGVLQADQTAEQIGDKAVNEITQMFEMAGFDLRDAEHKTQLAQVHSDGIIIAESPDEPKEEDDKPHTEDDWRCANDDCKNAKESVIYELCEECYLIKYQKTKVN